MKQRVINTKEELDKARSDMARLADHLPVIISVTEGKRIRSDAANSRYWSGLNEYLEQMNQCIRRVEENGYTNLEARRVIANEMSPENSAILYASKAEVIHDIIKLLTGVPTSTRLGSRDFQKFELIMEKTLGEIIGEINAIAGKA